MIETKREMHSRQMKERDEKFSPDDIIFTTSDGVPIRKTDKYYTLGLKRVIMPRGLDISDKVETSILSNYSRLPDGAMIAGPYINPKDWDQSGEVLYFAHKESAILAHKFLEESIAKPSYSLPMHFLFCKEQTDETFSHDSNTELEARVALIRWRKDYAQFELIDTVTP